MVDKLRRLLGGSLKGKKVAVLGLAFKAETDDVRESPAITIVSKLLEEVAEVIAHDPEAVESFRQYFPDIKYANKSYEAVEGADAVVIVTEWNEYRTMDISKIKTYMRGNILLDTRNVIAAEDALEIGFVYEGFGR
jgi:UDPglucose 6-dehydrogenase